MRVKERTKSRRRNSMGVSPRDEGTHSRTGAVKCNGELMEFLIGFSETNIDSNQQNTHITTDTHRRGNHQPHRLPPPREAPSHHQTIPPSGHPSITKPRPKADRSQNHETPNGFAETSRHQRPPMLAHALRAATTTSPKHDTGQIRLAHKRHTRTKPRPPGQQTTQSH